MSASAEPTPIMPYSIVVPQAPRYTLFRGSGEGNCYASSPFVTKVELRMRLAGIDYAIGCGAPWLGPKGKIPYIQLSSASLPSHQVNETAKADMLGDSALIIKYMVEQEGLQYLNELIEPQDKARDLALRALLEDKLYFYHMRECWIDNYHAQRDQALSNVPFPMRFFVDQIVYKRVVRTLFGQGAGRHDAAEVEVFRNEIWDSINDLLSAARMQDGIHNEPYWCLGGPQPTEADLTLFGFISAILTGTSCPKSAALLRSLPAVMEYADLIHRKYFTDYDLAQWMPDEKALVSDSVTVLARL